MSAKKSYVVYCFPSDQMLVETGHRDPLQLNEIPGDYCLYFFFCDIDEGDERRTQKNRSELYVAVEAELSYAIADEDAFSYVGDLTVKNGKTYDVFEWDCDIFEWDC